MFLNYELFSMVERRPCHFYPEDEDEYGSRNVGVEFVILIRRDSFRSCFYPSTALVENLLNDFLLLFPSNSDRSLTNLIREKMT